MEQNISYLFVLEELIDYFREQISFSEEKYWCGKD